MDYEQFLKQVAEDLKYSIPNATIEISERSRENPTGESQ